jgi:3-hydroxyisobutyrate dehydrogenase-like beta-hydroxyacid dehydrogenase
VKVTLIGLGEVGRVAVEDLAARGLTGLTAWDVAFDDPGSRASRNAADLPVVAASSAAGAVADADAVICAVTAANDLAAAGAAASGLRPGTWFVDLNSSSPEQKRQAAAVVHDVGGRYVEAALMSAIHPRRLAAPFLLGGPHAAAFLAEAAPGLGLVGASFYSSQVGAAAATKLCRSVIVKGLEALFTESLLAARSYGVEDDVLASLSNILPEADWESVARYFVSRSLQHGQRRSEEMVEAAATVAQAGVEPLMATAAAERQAWAAGHAEALEAGDLIGMLDAVRNRTETQKK